MVGQAVDELRHPGELGGVVERPVEDALVVGHPGPDLPGPVGHRRQELVVHAVRHQDAGSGGAVLPGVEVATQRDALGGGPEVGVVEDEDGCVAAELEVDPLQVRCRRLGDLGPGADRAGDGDHLGDRVRHQHPSGVPVTADDVEDTGREELLAQLGEHRGGRGRGVARLEDDGVAGGQRGGDLPHHHRQRVVPGSDLADHPDGLPPDERGVVAEVLPRRLALEHPGGAGEEPQVVDRDRHLLGARDVQRFAGVAALGLDELLGPRLQRVGDAEEREGPLLRGGVAPALEGALRRGAGAVEVLAARQRRLRVDPAGGRVHDVIGPAADRSLHLSVHDVAQLAAHGATLSHRCRTGAADPSVRGAARAPSRQWRMRCTM